MSVPTTETADRDDAGSRSKANQAISTIKQRNEDGSVTILVGSVMLMWALNTLRKSKSRAMVLALACVSVLGVGLRQRRAKQKEGEGGIKTGQDSETEVSADTRAESEQGVSAHRNGDESQSAAQSETEPDPRGISDRSDVQMDDGGESDFVEGKEPGFGRETDLEDEGARDTHLHSESDDERTEIDLSEAAMADEASEAAGPPSEQASPAFEGTDPEPTSEDAPERVGEGEPTSSQPDEREFDDKPQEDDNVSKEAADEPPLTEDQQEPGNPSATTEDPVRVPPETSDGLKTLYEAGELDPTDRENAIEQASERGFESTVKWLEKVGDQVYARAARGEFVAGGAG